MRTCSRCNREMTPSDEWRNPFSMCLECDPKGPWDELPPLRPGQLGYVPPPPVPPEPAKRWWRILRATELHPQGWVTVLEREMSRDDIEFVLLDLRGRYPEQQFKLEAL